jgi:hypothetical protein
MSQTSVITAVGAVILLSLLSACNRNQDQTTPVGQQEQGRSTAQEYPSTRNMEQSNPAVGGNNSATNKPAPSGSQESAGSTTR